MLGLYRLLGRLLREGGVFANADHMPVSTRAIADASQAALDDWQAVNLEEAEDYYRYRDVLREDPELRAFVEEGNRRFADKPPGIAAPLSFHRNAFLTFGFQHADEVWRYHADAILVAVR